jgi:internalin A
MSRKLILRGANRWFIPLMVLAALLLMLIPVSVARADEVVVTFPDPVLNAAILEAIGKTTGDIIYQSDLDNLTTLNASPAVADPTGLEHCTSLTHLVLNNNGISDFSSLAGLTNLTYLDLDGDYMGDPSPLAGLTNLTYLCLNRNQVSDLSPLAGLTNLTYLYLGGNDIRNLLPLAGLSNLTYLDLNYNPISNLLPLAGLTNLTYLGLNGHNQIHEGVVFPDPTLDAAIRAAIGKTTGDIIYQSDLDNLTTLNATNVSDIWGLEHCTSLTHLDLSDGRISDFSSLAGLTNLTYLYLGINQISDISSLTGLTNLTHLDLNRNPISDLSPLAGLTSLTYLGLGGSNMIGDLSLIAGLTNLTHLVLNDGGISDISLLSSLTNLTYLDLYSNQISDISSLAGLTNLTHLYLGVNQISDVYSLAGLTNLTYLELFGNPISDLSSLSSGFTSLTYLNLSSNQISDLLPLAGLTNLTHLDLSSTPISDLSPLAGLTNLTYLDFLSTPISDLSPLAGLTNLTYLDLGCTPISDVSSLSGLTNLTNLDLRSDPLLSDLSPLSSLTDLTYLELNACGLLSDISSLSGLPHLTYLGLSACSALTDLSSLSSGFTSLTTLNLFGGGARDISPLVNNPCFTSGLTINIFDFSNMNDYLALLAKGVNVTKTHQLHPATPGNLSPADGTTGVTLTPTLGSTAFVINYPSSSYTDWLSEWEITTSPGDYSNPVFNLISNSYLTTCAVPSGTLANSTTYYWRVRYVGQMQGSQTHGYVVGWSGWSSTTSFTTVSGPTPINTITTIQNGEASVAQNDGVAVNITGSTASDGTSVTVSSVDWGSIQPSATGAIQLSSSQYYDVNVSPSSNLGTNAMARVSITSPDVTSQTVMLYWYNGMWNNASNISISGTTISGDIPVSNLTGTPLVIGKDTTPPSIVASATKADTTAYAASSWTNQSVTVHYTVSDSGSGVASPPADVIYSTNGTYTASATVYDNAGNSAIATFGPITIDKTPPTVTVNTPANYGVYAEGMALNFSASDTGGSVLAFLTATLVSPQGTLSVSSGYVPGQGVYVLTIVATDNAGNSATEVRNFVVYDPSAGFVTGGGWINSPVNTNYQYMQVGGKASFGFVSKYLKGAKVPTGNTEFQFHEGSLNFSSTSYDWLVVNQNATNAQYKGSGTINGQGDYFFMLWAKDGSPDTFRIQIWDKATSKILYDNGTAQAIGGGSIVVHTRK